MIYKLAKTCWGGVKRTDKKAFTLAEILITLVVVGIIAAITISVISSNIRKAEVETKLKKTVALLNNAMFRAITDYGPANTWTNSDAGLFIKNYLLPSFTLLRQPEVLSLKELGYKNEILRPNGVTFNVLNSTERIFLNDGTVILRCENFKLDFGGILFLYDIDINGSKGPNISGIDVFVISIPLIHETPVANMYGLISRPALVTDSEGNQVIRKYYVSKESQMSNCQTSGQYCGALIQRNGWKIPKDYPHKI